MNIPPNLENLLKVLSAIGAVIVFGWGIVQFISNQRSQADTRRIEATKPFLERQLKLYTEATQAAATLSTSQTPTEIAIAKSKFWSLYWGELALVEDKRVETAMVELGRMIKSGKSGEQLQSGSLALAHACRDSLAESWGVRLWRNPHGS